MRRLSLWVPPLLYAALIFHFSSEPNPLPQLTAHVWDKWLHLVEYGGLGLLVSRALLGEGMTRARAVLVAVLVASAYAASDEWHQALVPSRSSDALDWVADAIGSTLGAIVLPTLGDPRGVCARVYRSLW